MRSLDASIWHSRAETLHDLVEPEADGQPLSDADRLVLALRGRLETNDRGQTAVFESRMPLAQAMPAFAAGLADLLAGPSATEPLSREAVFLDVETTGLRASPGTFVLVVGLGFVDGDDFVVRQHFLHDPAAEAAYLEATAKLIGRFDVVITFNGKRFDVPMLEGRYVLHRLPNPAPRNHVDLLHPAQRIWRRRLKRSNLATLEERILGVTRESDVPGYEIPSRYFAFLRQRKPELIAPVIDHNRQDVVSMAQLAGVISRLLHDVSVAWSSSPSDLLGLGSLLEVSGSPERAARCYEAALVGALPAERMEALLRLAALARRQNELDRAIQLYEAASGYSTARAATAAVELAKIYEHHVRRPDRALDCARRAFDLLRLQPSPRADSAVDDVVRRIARLEAKTSLGGRVTSD